MKIRNDNVAGAVTGRRKFALNPAADLIDDERRKIRQRCHVTKREDRPAPRMRLAPDDRQRAGALTAQREKYQERENGGDREYRPARIIVEMCVSQCLAQSRFANLFPTRLADFVGLHFTLPIDDAKGANHDFPRRKAGKGGNSDSPIPTEWPHRRFDRAPELTEQTVHAP